MVQVGGTAQGVTDVILKVFKDDVLFKEQAIVPSGTFNFNVKLKAGPFKYKFQLLGNQNQQVAVVENILCGDVFVFYGQSNSIGQGSEITTYQTPNDPFFRLFRENDLQNYNGDWVGADEFNIVYIVGMFPIEFMKKYRASSNYPVGVIQSAYSGVSLLALNGRNANDIYNIGTRYGELMRRLKISGLKDNLKYMLFRQGENEGTDPTASAAYPAQFQILMDNFSLDIPSLTHFFNYQLNVMSNTYSSSLDMEIHRDFQRRTELLYPKVRAIACAGIDDFNGVHYSVAGHAMAASSVVGILKKEVFQTTNSNNVYSPNIKKIFYNTAKTKIVLKFNDGIDMVYPNDSLVVDVNGFSSIKKMKDYIYLNGTASVVQAGLAIKNYIYLSIPQVVGNHQITYLQNLASPTYTGVHLKTVLGERAMTFARKTVVDAIATPVLTVTLTPQNKAQLSWASSNNVIHIERKLMDASSFVELQSTTQSPFVDLTSSANTVYEYRIWAENSISESEMSNSQSINIGCDPSLTISATQQVPALSKTSVSMFISSNLMLPNVVLNSPQIVLLPGFSTSQSFVFLAEPKGCN